jgi:hypothetical protein
MTWMFCLLSTSLLLAAGSQSANPCRPSPAPYYNQLADIIYPEPPACSEASQWVHLFDAMANQPRRDRRCAPERTRLLDDVRVSYRRDPEQQRLSERRVRELYGWMLADAEIAAAQECHRCVNGQDQATCTSGRHSCEAPSAAPAGQTCIHCQVVTVGANGQMMVREFTVPATATRSQQPDAMLSELGRTRPVANPQCLSRPCQTVCGHCGPAAVPAMEIIPCLPRVDQNASNEEQVRTELVPGTTLVRCTKTCRDAAVVVADGGKANPGPCRLSVPGIEATSDRMTCMAGQLLLEGHVVLELRLENHPAKILTDRALINIKNGTYEVMPVNLEDSGRISKPMSLPVP